MRCAMRTCGSASAEPLKPRPEPNVGIPAWCVGPLRPNYDLEARKKKARRIPASGQKSLFSDGLRRR